MPVYGQIQPFAANSYSAKELLGKADFAIWLAMIFFLK